MGVIEGPEWIAVAIYVVGLVTGAYLVVTAQGDRRIAELSADNSDEQAADIMVEMIGQTRRELLIHDDGNNSPRSVYNNERVLEAMRQRLQECPRMRIRCLFNDNEPLKLHDLAQSDDGRGRIEVWQAQGPRPLDDTHYKIVDRGRMLHLSFHAHGAVERKYLIRKPPGWALPTRRRISKARREHFESGVSEATRVV